ncbi:hypothetical protein J7W19_06940 [Streptomyces mobaraensis NBRC 13819 = DSM 40847]|uniref:Uncharacterized protein n=2 Tax=Streptomyces mobaraensis TaxID=35621 RepID=A0A5N5W7B7_STRMB|nr:hypothetical protein [Streptomyces mobaraensis]EME98185.1 hypothetical protein H340_22656 [Streptomyces mobaraensis NBRC 13819 = DSM 40847]KAB7843225.1 hypothetical protein FRZ00_17895 [Streptomyces mobaraensis]QTT73186.1 hypothetical protein J7W19_06940 [Streptomyces mobaraensis NBRC 13819 = DSM 40847]
MPAGRHTRTRGAAQTRLPWWAAVLPALAFTALFALLALPVPEASAAPAAEGDGTASQSAVAQVVRVVRHTLDGWIS